MSNVGRHHEAVRTKLGDFELIRPLARGGMAELFLVRSVGPEGFEKVVVLKRVLPHLADDRRFIRAFLDEAKLVASLDHPNIAAVYDMGSVDGSYYFTMEHVRGVDVRKILERCKRTQTSLPIEHAVIIARDIAGALHHVHERRGADGRELGLVHRDVSPSNVIVSFEGAPKLIDFGIAKATSTEHTQTGSLKGKVAYMSPEQARGAAIDRRTDIFALGVILWEMIAGKRLFKSENDLATLQRIIYEPAPSLRDACPDCPDRLVRIVARALALDPDARHATAQELQLELEELGHEHNLKLSTHALGTYLRTQFPDYVRIADEMADGTMTAITAPATPEDPELDVFDRATLAPSLAVTAPPPPAERHGRRWRWISATAVVLLAASLALLVTRDDESPPPHTAAPAPVVERAVPVAKASVTSASPVTTASPPAAEPKPAVKRARESLVRAPARSHPPAAKSSHVEKPHPETIEPAPREPAPAEPAPSTSKKPFDPDSVFPP